MSNTVDRTTANALRMTLAALIVTLGPPSCDRLHPPSNRRSKRAVDRAWQLYRGVPHPRLDESEFKASLQRATFIDQYSVDTYVLACLRLSF